MLGASRIMPSNYRQGAKPKAEFTNWVEPSTIAEVIQILASDASHAIIGAALGKG